MNKIVRLTLLVGLVLGYVNAQNLKDMVGSLDIEEANSTAMAKDSNQTTAHHHGKANNNPYYQGEVVTVEQGGAYTYLEIKEQTEKTFWVAVSSAEVKVGDYVRFQMELTAKNFKSTALGRVFEEIMFASNLQQRILKSKKTEDNKTK